MPTEEEFENLTELVERAKAGEREAFAVLYNEYLKPLYRFVYFRVSSKEEAEDLTQLVFLKAYGSLANFDNTKNSFSAWLYRIARNTVIDFFKKKKSTRIDQEEFANLKDEGRLGPEEEAIRVDEGDMIKTAILGLTAPEREVIEMKFFQDLSNKEIASLLERTEAGVRQIQNRALKKLKVLLKDKI